MRYSAAAVLRGSLAALVGLALVVGSPLRAGSDAAMMPPQQAAAPSPPPEVSAAPEPEPAGATAAFGHGPKTAFFPSDSPRELVLSFDDGPDLELTPLVLDELDRRGLKAIFFVTGQNLVGQRPEVLARRALVREIAARGHLVANHTLRHKNLCRAPSAADAAAEIDGNSELIAGVTGVRPLLFRAPYGVRCRELAEALEARQLVSVGWNIDPQDWRDRGSADVLTYLERKLGRLRGRGILLIHDTHTASVFALGRLFDWIARENQRAAAAGRPPIVLRDYRVFLPDRPLAPTGLEAVVAGVVRDLPLPAAWR